LATWQAAVAISPSYHWLSDIGLNEKMETSNRIIITAASSSYEESLMALLGSLNCNWPDHPPVLVYDIGMRQKALSELDRAGIMVRRVPAFCEHWRRHFTWKLWCMNEASCNTFFWIDAGICVLRPMDEVFRCAETLGYFVVPNDNPLSWGVNRYLRDRYGVCIANLEEIPSILGGFIALSRAQARSVLDEAMDLALIEEAMKCTKPYDRHDQDVLSLLLFRSFGPLLYADRELYGEWIAPAMHHCQKVWIHRRRMRPEDVLYFKQYLRMQGAPRIPGAPDYLYPPTGRLQRARIWLASIRGRNPYPPSLPAPTGGYIHDGVRDNPT